MAVCWKRDCVRCVGCNVKEVGPRLPGSSAGTKKGKMKSTENKSANHTQPKLLPADASDLK